MKDSDDNKEGEIQVGSWSSESLTKLVCNPHYKNAYDGNEEKLRKANKHLEREYVSIAVSSTKTALVAVLLIYILDHLIYVHPVVYGATLNALGAIFIVYPRFSGRYKIAGIVNNNRDIQMKASAENTAYTNIGFLFIILGFFVQIALFQLTRGGEFIQANHFIDIVPWWIGTVGIFMVFVISLPLGFANWRWWFGLSSAE